jgi:hypothetical protein
VPTGDPSAWDDAAVRELLVEVLRAIGRAADPTASADRTIVLRGFSWIVEPYEDQVVIAIEIPTGAAVAGPLAIGHAELDQMIARVLRAEHRPTPPDSVH